MKKLLRSKYKEIRRWDLQYFWQDVKDRQEDRVHGK